MSSSKSEASAGGVGFLGLLTIVLIVLKLLGYISISWWLVWMPMWIIPAFVIVVCILVFTIALAMEGRKASYKSQMKKRRESGQ